MLLVAALLFPGAWGRASAEPPRARHHLVAEYDLWHLGEKLVFFAGFLGFWSKEILSSLFLGKAGKPA